MIRVLVVDDHPVLRAGLEALLRAEPGFACVGVAGDAAGLWPQLGPCEPDVVLLDRNLPDADGIDVAREIQAQPYAPAIVLYTADPAAARGAEVTVAAVVDKATEPDVLFDALRLAARGVRPPSWPAA